MVEASTNVNNNICIHLMLFGNFVIITTETCIHLNHWQYQPEPWRFQPNRMLHLVDLKYSLYHKKHGATHRPSTQPVHMSRRRPDSHLQ